MFQKVFGRILKASYGLLLVADIRSPHNIFPYNCRTARFSIRALYITQKYLSEQTYKDDVKADAGLFHFNMYKTG